MNFIEDFNRAFSAFIIRAKKDDTVDEQSFVSASYLWVPFGWLLSIIIVLMGYFVSFSAHDYTIFFVVTFAAYLLKGTTDVTSKKSSKIDSFILLSVPFISYLLMDYNLWVFVIALYFPSLMMAKNIQISAQSKFFGVSEKKAFFNLGISLITYYLPMHLIFSSRMGYGVPLLLISFFLFIAASSLLTCIKAFGDKKDNSILVFSTSGLIFLIFVREILTYFSHFFF